MSREERVSFYINEELKKAFSDACKSQDSDMSRELRLFIRSYVKSNAQGELRL